MKTSAAHFATSYSVKILADSFNTATYDRLTTFELRYPRFIHSELMTHRLFSRNASSSRAIPTPLLMAQIQDDPAMPLWWGKNQSGMQAREELDAASRDLAIREWRIARLEMLKVVQRLHEIGLHKQLANRLLEPWMFITVILSATEFANWEGLRDHEDAQPELQWVARHMRIAREKSSPAMVHPGEVHLPLCPDLATLCADGYQPEQIKLISAGRCARVSYLTHDGIRDPGADLALALRLAEAGHMSPFEHVATALSDKTFVGNFQGWGQLRKQIPGERVYLRSTPKPAGS